MRASTNTTTPRCSVSSKATASRTPAPTAIAAPILSPSARRCRHGAGTKGRSRAGETWPEFGARVAGGVADLCEGLGRDDNVLLVSSGGVIGRYTADVLGAGPEAAIQLNLQTRNTGVTEFARTSSGATRLVAFNAIPHLEDPARAGAVTYS